MAENAARQRKHQNGLQKLSRRKREAQVGAGELDPKLDFICKYCGGIYTLGAEGVLPGGHIESFLRVFKQSTLTLPRG